MKPSKRNSKSNLKDSKRLTDSTTKSRWKRRKSKSRKSFEELAEGTIRLKRETRRSKTKKTLNNLVAFYSLAINSYFGVCIVLPLLSFHFTKIFKLCIYFWLRKKIQFKHCCLTNFLSLKIFNFLYSLTLVSKKYIETNNINIVLLSIINFNTSTQTWIL